MGGVAKAVGKVFKGVGKAVGKIFKPVKKVVSGIGKFVSKIAKPLFKPIQTTWGWLTSKIPILGKIGGFLTSPWVAVPLMIGGMLFGGRKRRRSSSGQGVPQQGPYYGDLPFPNFPSPYFGGPIYSLPWFGPQPWEQDPRFSSGFGMIRPIYRSGGYFWRPRGTGAYLIPSDWNYPSRLMADPQYYGGMSGYRPVGGLNYVQ